MAKLNKVKIIQVPDYCGNCPFWRKGENGEEGKKEGICNLFENDLYTRYQDELHPLCCETWFKMALDLNWNIEIKYVNGEYHFKYHFKK